MKLKELTRQLIEAHYEHLSDDNVRNLEKYVSPLHFLKELRTISIGTGRQTGRSTLIAEMVDGRDLIVANNSNFVRDMRKLCEVNNKNPDVVIYPVKLIDLMMYDNEKKYDRIFIDNSDLLKQGMLDLIYENVAGRCNQLILIRG